MELRLNTLISLLSPIGVNLDSDYLVSGISIDSRTIKKGEVFVALRGDRFDGHDFACEAVEKSKTFAIVEKPVNCPHVVVEDALSALKVLASYNLKISGATSIAIIGSVGKTTTKELVAGFLGCNNAVSKSFENENNVIGVCKTLLNVRKERFCVVEVGINKPKEMEKIADFFKPDGVLFLNVRPVHMEFFKSLRDLFEEKSKLINEKVRLIYNGDDEVLRSAFRYRKNSFCFSFAKKGCDFFGYFNGDRIGVQGFSREIFATLKEEINPVCFLGAVSCGMVFDKGVGEACVNNVVEGFQPIGLRMRRVRLNSSVVILDCYNANVDSMKYAIDVLSKYRGKKLAVLGDMLELGDYTEKAHRDVGEYLKSRDIDICAVGNSAFFIFDEARSKCKAWYYEDKKEASSFLKRYINKYDVVLFKASRGMKFEELYYSLKEG